jgi:haloalkane dehalogenase
MSPILQGGTSTELSDEVLAGYEKPFPNAASKAGARAFPGLIPQTPDAPGAEHGVRALEALRNDGRPKLMLWGADDSVLPPAIGKAFAGAIGAEEPTLLEGAGHFLQEDKGPEIGALIADWLGSSG